MTKSGCGVIPEYSSAIAIETPLTSAHYVEEIVNLAVGRGLLTGWTSRQVDAATMRARMLIQEARLALLAHERRAARGLFVEVARMSRTVPRVGIAILGILASLTGRDIEWLFRAAGRLSWPRSLYDDRP